MPVIWVSHPETLVQRLSAYCDGVLVRTALAAGRRQKSDHRGPDSRCGYDEGALGAPDVCHAATMLVSLLALHPWSA